MDDFAISWFGWTVCMVKKSDIKFHLNWMKNAEVHSSKIQKILLSLNFLLGLIRSEIKKSISRYHSTLEAAQLS